jgi:hypothetical protein
MNKDLKPSIKIFTYGDNWYKFKTQFSKLVTQSGLSIYFNPAEISIAIPQLSAMLVLKQASIARGDQFQPNDIQNADGTITTPPPFPVFLSLQESEVISKYHQKMQIYSTKCAQALTLLEIHLCPNINLKYNFPALTTFNKGAQQIHDVMEYLNEEHCQGNAINNAKSKRSMETIADFTTPELASSGMMTFVQLSEERDPRSSISID